MPKIRVNSGALKEYSVDIEDGSAIEAALNSFPMPCGGQHTCGKCAVQVMGECGRASERERLLLSMRLRSAPLPGYVWRMACMCVPRGDCSVYIEGNSDGLQVADGDRHGIEPRPESALLYGVAVDIGTTTISAVLYDVRMGRAVEAVHELNEQAKFGADVLSRINHAGKHGVGLLSQCVTGQLGRMMDALCSKHGMEPGEIGECVVTGNTTMLHLLMGYDPSSIGVAPFDVVSYFGVDCKVGELRCFLPRCIGAYVGADITCGILALGMDASEAPQLMVDIGTNGEMALSHDGRIICCATAAGPAFEGAEIAMGMTATAGAVSKIELVDGVPVLSVIGGARAKGLCGTGIISTISFMIDQGMIEPNGRIMKTGHAFERLIFDIEGTAAFRLGESEVYLSQRDIRNVQLAKAAIRAGMETLLDSVGLCYEDLGTLFISGGFGSFIDPAEAAAIGLIPEELLGKAVACGNTALSGAAMLICSRSNRERQDAIARNAEEIQLASNAFFMDQYIEQMAFYEE